MSTLRHAFKEWAVICRVLADGRQSIVLRKGGIAEKDGVFRLEHNRFWLYPTYVHQQKDGITPDMVALLEQVETERPPAGLVRLSHFAEVTGIYHVHDLPTAWKLAGLHGWSQETVQARFEYRGPGLFVLPVRVYRAPSVVELPETPAYAGCRSWVELDRDLPTDGANPILDEQTYDDVLNTLDRLLQPTAWV
jgi:hypothetical protein